MHVLWPLMSTVEVSHNLAVSMCRSTGEATMAVLPAYWRVTHFHLTFVTRVVHCWMGLWHMGSQVTGVRGVTGPCHAENCTVLKPQQTQRLISEFFFPLFCLRQNVTLVGLSCGKKWLSAYSCFCLLSEPYWRVAGALQRSSNTQAVRALKPAYFF